VIDPHVHCRDGKEAYEETIEHTLGVAESIELKAIFDMPNTNPPLRGEVDRKKLLKCLKNGEIDWIESDHTPHAIGEKLFPPYLSGYPSYKTAIDELVR